MKSYQYPHIHTICLELESIVASSETTQPQNIKANRTVGYYQDEAFTNRYSSSIWEDE